MSLIIVIFIFVDLIFNFSGLRMTKNNITEQFQSVAGQSYNSGNDGEGNNINNMLDSEDYDHRNIKSVVAKNDGRMFNIMFLPNDNENKTICVSSPVSRNANITVNSNGTLSQELKMTSKTNQQFLLLKINNGSDYSDVLGNNPLGANEFSAETKYPFYIIKSVQLSNWCLAYEPGKLFLAPIGNYNNQKWETIEIIKDDKGEWFINAYNDGSAFDDTGKGKVDYQQKTLVPLSDGSVQAQLEINMVDGNPVGYKGPKGELNKSGVGGTRGELD